MLDIFVPKLALDNVIVANYFVANNNVGMQP